MSLIKTKSTFGGKLHHQLGLPLIPAKMTRDTSKTMNVANKRKAKRRALTSYNIYFREQRKELQDQIYQCTGKVPDNKQIAAMVAERWRSIDVLERAKYEAAAAKAKRSFALDFVARQANQHGSMQGGPFSLGESRMAQASRRRSQTTTGESIALPDLPQVAALHLPALNQSPSSDLHPTFSSGLPQESRVVSSRFKLYESQAPLLNAPLQTSEDQGEHNWSPASKGCVAFARNFGNVPLGDPLEPLLPFMYDFDEDDAVFLQELFDSDSDSDWNIIQT